MMQMRIAGRLPLNAGVDDVWEFLLEPAAWVAFIPGAERIEALDRQTFRGIVKQQIGPLSASFEITTTLKDLKRPNFVVAEGRGTDRGIVGAFSFQTTVNLNPISASEVEMVYEVDVHIAGGVPSFGKRMLESKASSMQKQIDLNVQEELKRHKLRKQ